MNDTTNTNANPTGVSAQDAQAQLNRADGLRLDVSEAARRYGLGFIGSGVILGLLLALMTSGGSITMWPIAGVMAGGLWWLSTWTQDTTSTPRGVKRRNWIAGILTVIIVMGATPLLNWLNADGFQLVPAILAGVVTAIPYTIAGLATLRSAR